MSEITHEVFGRTISGRLSAALLPAEGPDQVTVRVVGRASAAYIVKAQNRTATNEMKPGLSDASYYTSSSSARADGVEFFSVELPFVDAGGRFEGSVPTGLPPALSVDASGHSQRLGPGDPLTRCKGTGAVEYWLEASASSGVVASTWLQLPDDPAVTAVEEGTADWGGTEVMHALDRPTYRLLPCLTQTFDAEATFSGATRSSFTYTSPEATCILRVGEGGDTIGVHVTASCRSGAGATLGVTLRAEVQEILEVPGYGARWEGPPITIATASAPLHVPAGAVGSRTFFTGTQLPAGPTGTAELAVTLPEGAGADAWPKVAVGCKLVRRVHRLRVLVTDGRSSKALNPYSGMVDAAFVPRGTVPRQAE